MSKLTFINVTDLGKGLFAPLYKTVEDGKLVYKAYVLDKGKKGRSTRQSMFSSNKRSEVVSWRESQRQK